MAMLTDEMKRMLREQRLGFVATVCPDGTPNLSPKGTTVDLDDEHLMFADIRSPETVRNLAHNPWVEVNVVDPLLRKGWRFKGRGEVHEAGAVFERAMEVFRARGVAWPVQAVVVVRVERALPLTSPGYDGGATEEEVAGRWARYWRDLWAPWFGPDWMPRD